MRLLVLVACTAFRLEAAHSLTRGFCSSEPVPSANHSLPPAIISHALVAHVGLLRSCLSGRTQSPGFFHGHTCSDAVTIGIDANNGGDLSVPGAKAGGVVLGFEPVPSTVNVRALS